MTKMCIKAIVSGKVQGVFFRDTTQKKAQILQITGCIKNTADGNVELIACGEQDHIMELTDWLWMGSDAAEVSSVHWEEIPWVSFNSFKIER